MIYRSDYPFDIFKLFLLVIVLPVMWFTVLITPLISSNFSCWSLYCLSCDLPFWLPLWYLQTFLVGHCIACHVIYRSDYPFDIFKLFLLVICIACHVIYRIACHVMWFTVLITPLISSNFSCWSLYCLSCDLPFWLPLWYLQTFLVGHCIACHVSYRSALISSNFSCWLLYCLSCDLPFWLPLWYLQTFLVGHCIACHVSYVLITPLISSNVSCWSLYCLSCELPFWLPLWYLQTFLVGHCIACHSIYRSYYPFDIFKLFLLVIVLPVMWDTVLITPVISSNFSCWSLYCLSCELPFWLPLWYLQTFLVGHCIACHSSYRSHYPFDIFKLFLLVIVLPVMWVTVLITPLISSNFSCWSLYCLSCELPFWLPLWYFQTFLFGHCIACHSSYRSYYPFDIFKLFLLVIVLPVMWYKVLITPLISSNFSCWSLYFLSCDLPFWLPLWYLQTFLVGHCIACHVIYRSDYPFDIFKLFLLVIVLPVMWYTVLITPLISSNFSCWSLYFLSCDLPFWLPLWYLQAFPVGHCIACQVIYRSDYPFDIFKLFLLVIVLPVIRFTVLITPLISSNFSCWSLYCLSCELPFWLPLWYLQTFLVGHCIACHVSYVLITPSISSNFSCWSLYCLSFVLPVMWCYRSDYPFDIFKLFLLVIVLPVMWVTVLITPLISSNFSCWALDYLSFELPFLLPLWYLQTFLFGHCIACHLIYRSDYHFNIFKLFLLVIVLPVMWYTVLITPLISSNFSCWSLYFLSYDLPFWLPLWYLQTFLVGHCIACHVIYRSDYPFDIFKPFLLVIVFPVMWYTVLITPLISSNFSCWSLYFLSCDLPFWLSLWYLQTFLVGHCIACHVIYRSDYPFDIFKLFLLVIVLPVMWFTVLITPLISSNFSCWLLYCLSCDIKFWLPLCYLQSFLVGHCISCHVIYRSDYPFDIFKLFLLVIVLPVMWFTVLVTPLISSNFSCWSLYCLSCELPFRLPLWYFQTFLVGHCIACHSSYRSYYPFDIFKLSLLVIVLPVIWFTVLITTLISSNCSCWLLYCLSCDIKFWLPLWYLQTFLVGHCISCHVIYRSDYPFDIFKLFLFIIALPVMWFTVLITPLISSNFPCWSLYCLSCQLPFWLPLWYLQTFLVGYCIACHVIYRSDYPFDIFKLFLLVIVLPVMWVTFWLPLWYLQTFLVGHCIACHVSYRSDYPFDIFKLFFLVIVLPVIRVTVLITPLISSNFSCWSLYCLSFDLPFWLPL